MTSLSLILWILMMVLFVIVVAYQTGLFCNRVSTFLLKSINAHESLRYGCLKWIYCQRGDVLLDEMVVGLDRFLPQLILRLLVTILFKKFHFFLGIKSVQTNLLFIEAGRLLVLPNQTLFQSFWSIWSTTGLTRFLSSTRFWGHLDNRYIFNVFL